MTNRHKIEERFIAHYMERLAVLKDEALEQERGQIEKAFHLTWQPEHKQHRAEFRRLMLQRGMQPTPPPFEGGEDALIITCGLFGGAFIAWYVALSSYVDTIPELLSTLEALVKAKVISKSDWDAVMALIGISLKCYAALISSIKSVVKEMNSYLAERDQSPIVLDDWPELIGDGNEL